MLDTDQLDGPGRRARRMELCDSGGEPGEQCRPPTPGGSTMRDMAVSKLSERGGKAGEVAPLHMRVTLEERRRIKVAAAAAEMSYAELFLSLLDERDARFERARRLQSNPLDRSAAQAVDEDVDE